MATQPPLAPDAGRDAVTGLPGREVARARLAEWLERGEPVHAILLGLRRFDAVNTAYGSTAGDAALLEVSQRIRHFAAEALDGAWLSARSSGGQFLLIASEGCSRERWQFLAGVLLEAVARPIAVNEGTVRLSPRAVLLRGVARDETDALLDRLGHSLARLMEGGTRQLAWADGESIRVGRTAARLETDLLAAIDRDEIKILFQPQFACADDSLCGAEALARWDHPELGRVGAGTLFAVAERADHMTQLSGHIARRALEKSANWPEGLRLSLNVTPGELATPDFGANLLALVEEVHFPARRLTLEITEQALLGDLATAANSFRQLDAHGIRIALDDFGAGFCNFRYLKALPLHYLKLDRTMIEGVTHDPRDLAVLRAIIAMARALDLKVIVEGIESEDQRLIAAHEGGHAYQGFLRAQPMGAAEFLALVRGVR